MVFFCPAFEQWVEGQRNGSYTHCLVTGYRNLCDKHLGIIGRNAFGFEIGAIGTATYCRQKIMKICG